MRTSLTHLPCVRGCGCGPALLLVHHLLAFADEVVGGLADQLHRLRGVSGVNGSYNNLTLVCMLATAMLVCANASVPARPAHCRAWQCFRC